MITNLDSAETGVLGECVFSGKYRTKIFDIDINSKELSEQYGK